MCTPSRRTRSQTLCGRKMPPTRIELVHAVQEASHAFRAVPAVDVVLGASTGVRARDCASHRCVRPEDPPRAPRLTQSRRPKISPERGPVGTAAPHPMGGRSSVVLARRARVADTGVVGLGASRRWLHRSASESGVCSHNVYARGWHGGFTRAAVPAPLGRVRPERGRRPARLPTRHVAGTRSSRLPSLRHSFAVALLSTRAAEQWRRSPAAPRVLHRADGA